MTLPSAHTVVTYPDAETQSRGVVLHAVPGVGGRTTVILDRTAAHPVDTAWPDQPADTGRMLWAGGEATIVEAVVGGIRDGELLLGPELPVRMGTAEWVFVVGHVLEGAPPEPGTEVEVRVDADRRLALSAGHTACHLASLALDAALADAWTKPVRPNTWGVPSFEMAASQSSRIEPWGSVDVYRVGKSLRKAGFTVAALEDPDAVADRVNVTLAGWVAAGAAIRIDRDGDTLPDRRTWVCTLPDTEARIPCGGTHLSSLAELTAITVELDTREVPGGLELHMRTRVAR